MLIAKMVEKLDTLGTQMASINTAVNNLTQQLNNPSGTRSNNNNRPNNLHVAP